GRRPRGRPEGWSDAVPSVDQRGRGARGGVHGRRRVRPVRRLARRPAAARGAAGARGPASEPDRHHRAGARRGGPAHRRPVNRGPRADRRPRGGRVRRPRRGDPDRGRPPGERDRAGRDPAGARAVTDPVERVLAETFREDWGRVVATLIGVTGDWDLAEECAQEAFAVAVSAWRRDGVPEQPRGWLIATARNRAVDRIRRD